MKKLVRRRLKQAGHVERMGNKTLPKRADAQNMDGRRRRGRSRKLKRDIWKECEENREQQQNMEVVGD